MDIVLNGQPQSTTAPSLELLLQELKVHEVSVATAVNGEFVPRARRESVLLQDGDAVEIVAPMQGG